MEEEVAVLKMVLTTDLKEVSTELAEAEQKMEEAMAVIRGGGGEILMEEERGEEGSDEYDSEAEDDAKYERREVDFDFKKHVNEFASNDVLKWYIYLLGDYALNPVELNHALVKMLHRVAFDLNSHPRLYQVSLFAVLENVRALLEGRTENAMKKSFFYVIYHFGFHLLGKFSIAFSSIGSMLSAEACYWKTPQDRHGRGGLRGALAQQGAHATPDPAQDGRAGTGYDGHQGRQGTEGSARTCRSVEREEEAEEDDEPMQRVDDSGEEEDTVSKERSVSAVPSEEKDEEEGEITVATPKSKRRRVVNSSSDEEEEATAVLDDTTDAPAAAPEPRKLPDLAPTKKMRRLMSDDEDD